MRDDYFEVDFNTYCNKCKHKDRDAVSDPCNECLAHGYNENTRKPVFYEDEE